MFKKYYFLIKPNLIFGNAITFAGGFALGSRGDFNFRIFLAALVGLTLVMASGCVFNNYVDRDLDALMERTRGRALVTGRVSGAAALRYGTILGATGFLVLAFFTNALATGAALFGFFFYVVMYSLWWKRKSPLSAVIGSFSGAVPPVAGYVAAGNRLDLGAAFLFAILAFWQIPHFFSIAIRHLSEYSLAKIPVFPLIHGIRGTKLVMAFYVAAFAAITPLLSVFGYSGGLYFFISLFAGLSWLAFSLRGFWAEDDLRWGKQMFLFSLCVLASTFAAAIASVLSGKLV